MNHLKNSARDGCGEACRKLCCYYSTNDDHSKAMYYMKRGFHLQDGDCTYMLALHYREGHGGFEQSNGKYIYHLKNAAEIGAVKAQYEYHIHLLGHAGSNLATSQLKSHPHFPEALFWHRLAVK